MQSWQGRDEEEKIKVKEESRGMVRDIGHWRRN